MWVSGSNFWRVWWTVNSLIHYHMSEISIYTNSHAVQWLESPHVSGFLSLFLKIFDTHKFLFYVFLWPQKIQWSVGFKSHWWYPTYLKKTVIGTFHWMCLYINLSYEFCLFVDSSLTCYKIENILDFNSFSRVPTIKKISKATNLQTRLKISHYGILCYTGLSKI